MSFLNAATQCRNGREGLRYAPVAYQRRGVLPEGAKEALVFLGCADTTINTGQFVRNLQQTASQQFDPKQGLPLVFCGHVCAHAPN